MSGELELSAWLAHFNPKSLASFEAHASRLRRVYPVWYTCTDSGAASRRTEAVEEERRRVTRAAKAHGVEVWGLISNYNEEKSMWDAQRMSLLLRDPAAAKAHFDSLLSLAKADGAQGVDLDYECMLPEDRQALSDFVAALCRSAKSAGLKVGMPVHAKDSEPGLPSGSATQDYAALAASLDLLQLMAYDYHWSTSGPGPIAPPDWGRRVLDHALSLASPEKIEFGFPSYGYDWKGRQADSLQFDGWEELVRLKGPARRDADSAELCLKYDGREAWFVDSVAMLRKFKAAQDLRVSKLAFWVLGSEDPRMWEMLESFPSPFAKTASKT